MIEIDRVKACTGCGEEKPLDAFYPTRIAGRTYPSGRCRPCHCAYSVARNRETPGRRAYELAYQKARRDARRTSESRICPRCGSSFTWTSSRPGQVYCAADCRTAFRRGLRGGGLSAKQRARVKERDGWRCYLCGLDVPRDARWPDSSAGTIDHVIPVAQGGPNTMSNLRLAHWICNVAKGAERAPWWIEQGVSA
jgi:hypothetical protein